MQDETLYFVTNNEILATKRSFLLPRKGYFLDHTVAEPRFLKVVFHNRKVSHVLPYNAPNSNEESNILYEDSRIGYGPIVPPTSMHGNLRNAMANG